MSDTTHILTGADLAIAAAKATGWTVIDQPIRDVAGYALLKPDGVVEAILFKNDRDEAAAWEWFWRMDMLPRFDRDPAARDALLTEAARRGWIFNMTVNPPGDDDPAGAAYAVFWVKTPGGKHVPIEVTVPSTDTAAFCTAVGNAFVRAAAAADTRKAGTE